MSLEEQVRAAVQRAFDEAFGTERTLFEAIVREVVATFSPAATPRDLDDGAPR
jgi:hypothetical protein